MTLSLSSVVLWGSVHLSSAALIHILRNVKYIVTDIKCCYILYVRIQLFEQLCFTHPPFFFPELLSHTCSSYMSFFFFFFKCFMFLLTELS